MVDLFPVLAGNENESHTFHCGQVASLSNGNETQKKPPTKHFVPKASTQVLISYINPNDFAEVVLEKKHPQNRSKKGRLDLPQHSDMKHLFRRPGIPTLPETNSKRT